MPQPGPEVLSLQQELPNSSPTSAQSPAQPAAQTPHSQLQEPPRKGILGQLRAAWGSLLQPPVPRTPPKQAAAACCIAFIHCITE